MNKDGKRIYSKNRKPIDCSKDGKTKQEYKDICDINNVMSKYARGIMPDYTREDGSYVDVSQVGDYQDAQNRIATANSEFDRLPAKIKQRFRNDVGQFVEYMNNLSEKNRQEAEELGLVERTKIVREEFKEEPKKEESTVNP